MDTDLKGKTIVVTGGSGGIGGAIVETLLGEGAHVAIHAFRAVDRAHQLQQQHSQLPGRAIVVQADLTRETEAGRMFAEVRDQLGPPQVLVANAGDWPADDSPASDLPRERWDRTLAANLTSVFLTVQAFLQDVAQNGLVDPAIVVTGSTAGSFGEAGHADYAAAKAGLMYGLVPSLKNEIVRTAPRGRINAVCPGWTITPMTEKFSGNEAAVARALQTIALRKFAIAQDIAHAVTFLASNRLAGHISGQTLFVSGGMEGRVLHAPDEIRIEDAIPQA